MEKATVGIGVSRDRLHIAIRSSGEFFCVNRDAAGFKALCAQMAKVTPDIVVLEATGAYETTAQQHCPLPALWSQSSIQFRNFVCPPLWSILEHNICPCART